MTFGVIDTGFSAPDLIDIVEDIEEAQRADISPGLNQSATSVLGQLNGINGTKLLEAWEVLAAVYRAQDPDSATGEALDNICARTGVTRLAATKSTATITATGTPTTVLPAGRVVSVDGNSAARFTSLADATIAAVTAWVNTTAYVIGDRRTNASKVYVCITSGTSAGTGGPTTTASDITDGTVHWAYVGSGTGAVDVDMEAEETGPTVAVAGTLTEIETAVTGWDGAVNLLDADEGRNIESDAALRLRRTELLETAGAGTTAAIRAAVRRVDDVSECFVFANNTDAVDGDGVSAHGVEVVVSGGDDDEIAQAIFDNVAAGTAINGSASGNAEDENGDTVAVAFSRPTEIDIYHGVEIRINAALFPADGDAQVKAAVVALGDALGIGDDVVSSAHYAAIFGISGVTDVVAVKLGIAPAPAATTTISIGARERAIYDTSRVSVTHI